MDTFLSAATIFGSKHFFVPDTVLLFTVHLASRARNLLFFYLFSFPPVVNVFLIIQQFIYFAVLIYSENQKLDDDNDDGRRPTQRVRK